MAVGSYFLLSSSLSKIVSLGVLATAAIAIPAAMVPTVSQRRESILNNNIRPLSQQSETWYKTLEDNAKAGGDKIWGTYKETYSDAAQELNTDLNNVGQELKKGEKAINSITPYLTNEYIDSYNYHSFINREVINALFAYLPTIVRDSIKDGMVDGENYEMLSFRKIMHIIHHKKFSQLVHSLSKLGVEKQKILNQTTSEDAQGVMEVLRNLPFEEGAGQHDDKSSPRIDKFMEAVIKNIDNINNDQTRSYTTAKDLIIDILVGKNAKQATKENLKKVMDQLKDKTKEITEKVSVDNAHMEQAKAILEILKTILESPD